MAAKRYVLKVELDFAPNPDFDHRGGFPNGEPPRSEKGKRVEVADIEDAARVCRRYIERNGLGAGNWTGGIIYRTDRGPVDNVGRIAFNGRFIPAVPCHGCGAGLTDLDAYADAERSGRVYCEGCLDDMEQAEQHAWNEAREHGPTEGWTE